MNPVKIILGLIPFALFSLLAETIPVGWAALVGLVAALVAVAIDIRTGLKAVPVVAVITMGAFAALAFVGEPAVAAVLGSYGRGLATLVLAAYILITSAFSPFTSAYAKESTPRQYWGSAEFVALNRRLSLAWGGTVLLMAAGHLVAEAIATAGVTVPLISAALNWGLPIFAIMKTVDYTKRAAQAAV
ncbi:MAG: hypothetical protein ABUT11_00980 [Leifsonia sp.]